MISPILRTGSLPLKVDQQLIQERSQHVAETAPGAAQSLLFLDCALLRPHLHA